MRRSGDRAVLRRAARLRYRAVGAALSAGGGAGGQPQRGAPRADRGGAVLLCLELLLLAPLRNAAGGRPAGLALPAGIPDRGAGDGAADGTAARPGVTGGGAGAGDGAAE